MLLFWSVYKNSSMRVDAVSASSAAAVYAIYIARYTPLLWINAVYFISAEFYGSVSCKHENLEFVSAPFALVYRLSMLFLNVTLGTNARSLRGPYKS